jgi:hypothetical protein
MYYAVMKNGICIAKIVLNDLSNYIYPFFHDELVYDPDNHILVYPED